MTIWTYLSRFTTGFALAFAILFGLTLRRNYELKIQIADLKAEMQADRTVNERIIQLYYEKSLEAIQACENKIDLLEKR